MSEKTTGNEIATRRAYTKHVNRMLSGFWNNGDYIN